ncbi:hypothetical protein HOE04_02200 [archaeon]|jgi:hypothetical protein|nr:hypothetical protein [archaeon]
MKREVTIIAIVFIILVATAIASSMIFDWDNTNKKTIGGDKDSHGCLISAGYTYDSEIKACTRNWEIDENNEKIAAKIAVESIDTQDQDPPTIENINPVECPGCFVVSVDNKEEKELIYINDWEVVDENIITIAECTVEGGRIVDKSFDLECNENEKNLGCVENCMNSLICCAEDRE